MAEMMELLLAVQEDMKAVHEDVKAGKEKNEQILARMEAQREEREAERKAYLENVKRMMAIFGANQEETKSDPEQTEPSPEMMQSVGEHQEVTEEEAAVMPAGEPKNWNLAAERRQKPKKRTRGYCGSQKIVTIAGRNVSRRAAVARRKRDIFAQERTMVMCGSLEQLIAASRGATLRGKMAGRETAKRRTFGKKRQSKQQGVNGVKDLGGGRPRCLRKQDLKKLQLESTGNLNATLTTRREIAKRIISSTATEIINIWTLWRGRPPPKRKKGPHTEQEPVM
jgi:hypothetical protein